MENILLSEVCKKCAQCCKHFPFIELSQNEIIQLEETTGLCFDVFTNPKSETGEGFFLQFKEDGDCFFLNEHNGEYSCGVYDARGAICRNYPSKPKQKEACYANKILFVDNNIC